MWRKIVLILLMFTAVSGALRASENTDKDFDASGFILDHLGDAYEWHITTIGDKHISIPLPVIVYSSEKGLNVFMSSKLHPAHQYYGYYIAPEGKYKGKIVEQNAQGEEVRPLDLSLTKNAASLLIASALLIILVLYVAHWYKDGVMKAPKGFRGAMEMLIINIQDDVIKPSVGEDYRKFTPYLLTAFFFIFINNLLGLIPIFPGGANVTGNIAVTFVLAMFTFVIVNVNGTKEYWKEIFWPDVPTWLKVPVPLMPVIELFGIFTKPFALMVRLFANIMAGHAGIMAFMCMIFFVAKMGTGLVVGMTTVSVLFSIFMNCLEILVAFIQAYIFVMLSSVFIGLARVKPHKKTHRPINRQEQIIEK